MLCFGLLAHVKPAASRGRIWTHAFLLLCLAQFLGYAHYALLTPTLPLYLTYLRGSPLLVGFLLAVFSASSVVVRPALGYLADVWRKEAVLVLGCVFLSATVLLFLVPRIEVAFLANALRGIAWAGLNTGGYSLLAVVVPADRRGEASGFYSGIQSSTSIFFPPLALWLMNAAAGEFAAVFLASAVLALMAAASGAVADRTARHTAVEAARSQAQARPTVADFFDRSVLLPAGLLLCMNLPYTALTSFIVLYAQERDIGTLGWYFVATGTASLLGRPFLGRVSDRIGRGRAIMTGCVTEILGILCILTAQSMSLLVLGGMLYFLGYAMGVATTLALAMERSDPVRRGRAMATFSIAFPLGSALGAVFAGGLVSAVGYQGMYAAAAAVVGVGLCIAAWQGPGLNALRRADG